MVDTWPGRGTTAPRPKAISGVVHHPPTEIVSTIPDDVLNPVPAYPGVRTLLAVEAFAGPDLKRDVEQRLTRQ